MDTRPGAVADPLYAWVDLGTVPASRVQLATAAATAEALARAFLTMGQGEPVSADDVVDAFGQIANLLGGNIKALLPEHARLTRREVSRAEPPGQRGVAGAEALFAWRARPLVISLYTI
jgi:hypothetical protein